MPDMLKTRVVLHLRVHHDLVWWGRCASLVRLITAFILLIIVAAAGLASEVSRTFVFVCAAILCLRQHIANTQPSPSEPTQAYVLKPPDNLIDIRGRVLVQLLVMTENDDGDIDGAEDGELVRLLEQAAFALEEGHGSVAVISNWRVTSGVRKRRKKVVVM